LEKWKANVLLCSMEILFFREAEERNERENESININISSIVGSFFP